MQLRARRRYRTLLRQAQALEKLGKTDETLAIELRRLEQDDPTLKERVTWVEGRDKSNVDSSVKQDTLESSSVSTTPSTFPISSFSVKEKESESNFSVTSSKGNLSDQPKSTDCVSDESSDAASPFSGGGAFLFCAATIWSEAHVPTSLSVFSYCMITFLTILTSVLHRYVVDPSSMLGELISPVLFSCLVHFQGLMLIHWKMPGRISRAMLSVYLFFDFLPSMVFVFVVYTLTATIMELVEHHFYWSLKATTGCVVMNRENSQRSIPMGVMI
ncbi:hypothetical protein TraAM80_01574 [Trypanosoma rangeli]|uniref:Uncharacterized protein n=1 Tax=Trypanosoma rangeli TaxID=5698 RepID=A0A3R7NR92_TRYRA|nr:uncharacterized protein TraAM80_01574 [Trypanosoma rangeli]RNF10402.1 hypothetical protein TraAM80_01574 [Trypanosoma rangeli]|eukprot:RNF10402.1 hypothetical protein TraAM80_01574 [Trypanosoma rangeli]